ncbi:MULTISPECIES: hypothetical protein [unclassified Corallococcus]|uniref:hypothetical protein n=1 Tax=unclassified Corallococcus TaxID=2685029 RepID=UPI001A8F8F1A|nr:MULTISPECIES: hypothetical protein [unclassified Corallococcus]MBN9687151.1 hypothetical protein [Corallococcus sp. NCSPR001]WAS89022.1 hypothetical protein O0N60_19065 [Corallococcus sp. NCRR]
MTCLYLHLTAHAVRRGAERLQLNQERLLARAAHVYRHGTPLQDCPGPLRTWLEQEARLHPGSLPLVRGRQVFVFAPLPRLTLVTVVLIPKPFMAHLRHLTGVGRACFPQQHASKD